MKAITVTEKYYPARGSQETKILQYYPPERKPHKDREQNIEIKLIYMCIDNYVFILSYFLTWAGLIQRLEEEANVYIPNSTK